MEVEGVGKMRSVMLSIKPKYCELIVSGKKTIEVRKTRPKIETPFKCLIYECKGKKVSKIIDIPKEQGGGVLDYYEYEGCGKVIGEFVCDKIDSIVHSGTSNENIRLYFFDYDWTHRPLSNEYLYQTQLTYAELDRYSNGGNLYGWHISDLKIYDKPKELGKFANKSSVFTFGKEGKLVYTGMTRSPQSWCYMEELKCQKN